jgi:hypothetical protein
MTIPRTKNALVLRTDFSDETAWKELSTAIEAPVGEFQARVTLLSDRSFESMTLQEMIRLASDAGHRFIFIADQVALTGREHPLLVVDLADQPGRTFRVVSSETWAVENNLSLANMSFDEFADAVDDEGIFQGFPNA